MHCWLLQGSYKLLCCATIIVRCLIEVCAHVGRQGSCDQAIERLMLALQATCCKQRSLKHYTLEIFLHIYWWQPHGESAQCLIVVTRQNSALYPDSPMQGCLVYPFQICITASHSVCQQPRTCWVLSPTRASQYMSKTASCRYWWFPHRQKLYERRM